MFAYNLTTSTKCLHSAPEGLDLGQISLLRGGVKSRRARSNRFGAKSNRFGAKSNRFGAEHQLHNHFGAKQNHFWAKSDRFGARSGPFRTNSTRAGTSSNRFGAKSGCVGIWSNRFGPAKSVRSQVKPVVLGPSIANSVLVLSFERPRS